MANDESYDCKAASGGIDHNMPLDLQRRNPARATVLMHWQPMLRRETVAMSAYRGLDGVVWRPALIATMSSTKAMPRSKAQTKYMPLMIWLIDEAPWCCLSIQALTSAGMIDASRATPPERANPSAPQMADVRARDMSVSDITAPTRQGSTMGSAPRAVGMIDIIEEETGEAATYAAAIAVLVSDWFWGSAPQTPQCPASDRMRRAPGTKGPRARTCRCLSGKGCSGVTPANSAPVAA